MNVVEFEALLHERVRSAALTHFQAGQYRSAVLDAIISVFDLLRERTGLPLDGEPLVTETFSLKKPRLIVGDLASESGSNEQVGLMMMLQGVFRALRNPRAHSLAISTQPSAAAQVMVLCSLLTTRIEEARPGSVLRFDGYYLSPLPGDLTSGARLLRFYPDGQFIRLTLGVGPVPPETIWSWFKRENAKDSGYQSGQYSLDDDAVLFPIDEVEAHRTWAGRIDGSRLRLKSSSPSGEAYDAEYEFVPILT